MYCDLINYPTIQQCETVTFMRVRNREWLGEVVLTRGLRKRHTCLKAGTDRTLLQDGSSRGCWQEASQFLTRSLHGRVSFLMTWQLALSE